MEQAMLVKELPPMYRNKYLAHSLGGYMGYKYLNCEEGLLNALLNGHKYFEVDLMFTEDDELVCSHGWNEVNCEKTGMPYKPEFEHMTRDMFLEQKVHGFTTMDAKRLYQYMLMYPDTYWELDLHTLPKPVAKHMAEKILEVFEHNEAVLDRCLVQVNNRGMYKAINKVHHFKYYQFNFKNAIEKLDFLIQFSVDNGICAMAMKSAFATKENIEKVRNAGLALLVFTTDNPIDAKRYLDWGANTICSNFLTPEPPKMATKEAKIVYNSCPNAKEGLSKLIADKILRGSLIKTPKGSYEYTDTVTFSEKGKYTIMRNPYTKRFHKFLGWEIRRRNQENQWEWYCTDELWRSESTIANEKAIKYRVPDKATIQESLLNEERKLFLVAAWK